MIYNMVAKGKSGGGGGTVEVEPNDVTFIDYDGTVLYSYTAEEFLALNEMPANPSHDGLISQGWNWTLADARTQVQEVGEAIIGQMYITDDGKTRLYCRFEEGRLSPYLGLGVNGTVVVDWGDGSATDTLTGTSLTTVKNVQHTYAEAGDYIITLDVTSGSASILGQASRQSHLLKATTTLASNNESRVYCNAILKVEIGEDINLGDYAFYHCANMEYITIPRGVDFGTYAFAHSDKIKTLIIPSNVSTIKDYFAQYCGAMKYVSIPAAVTNIKYYALAYCTSLTSLVLPRGVNTLGDYTFTGCSYLKKCAMPNSVSSLGNSILSSCTRLKELKALINTSIPTSMFSACSLARSAYIPVGIRRIESTAFNSCYSLSSVEIPNTVTALAANAFTGCLGIGRVVCRPETPPTLEASSSFQVSSACTFYVPHGSLEAYQSATNWSTYASRMVEMD